MSETLEQAQSTAAVPVSAAEVRKLAADLQKAVPQIQSVDRGLAMNLGRLQDAIQKEGAADGSHTRDRLAFAVQDTERQLGKGSVPMSDSLRKEMTERAVTIPGLQNEQMNELLKSTETLDDRRLVVDIRRTAFVIAAEEGSGGSAQAADTRIEDLRRRAGTAGRPALPIEQVSDPSPDQTPGARTSNPNFGSPRALVPNPETINRTLTSPPQSEQLTVRSDDGAVGLSRSHTQAAGTLEPADKVSGSAETASATQVEAAAPVRSSPPAPPLVGNPIPPVSGPTERASSSKVSAPRNETSTGVLGTQRAGSSTEVSANDRSTQTTQVDASKTASVDALTSGPRSEDAPKRAASEHVVPAGLREEQVRASPSVGGNSTPAAAADSQRRGAEGTPESIAQTVSRKEASKTASADRLTAGPRTEDSSKSAASEHVVPPGLRGEQVRASPSPGGNSTPAPAPDNQGRGSEGTPESIAQTASRKTAVRRIAEASGPAVKASSNVPYVPFGGRVASQKGSGEDRQADRLMTRAETAGRNAAEAVETFTAGVGRSFMNKLEAAAQREPGGAAAVLQEMRQGGKYAELRQEFDKRLKTDAAFARAYGGATNAVGDYGKARIAVNDRLKAKGLNTSLADQRLQSTDAALGEEASRIPGRTQGKSVLEELAEKASAMLQKAIDKVTSVFRRPDEPATQQAARAAPTMSMG